MNQIRIKFPEWNKLSLSERSRYEAVYPTVLQKIHHIIRTALFHDVPSVVLFLFSSFFYTGDPFILSPRLESNVLSRLNASSSVDCLFAYVAVIVLRHTVTLCIHRTCHSCAYERTVSDSDRPRQYDAATACVFMVAFSFISFEITESISP